MVSNRSNNSNSSRNKRSTKSSTIGGLAEGSVCASIANQTFHKEARKFKDHFGKTYAASAVVRLWSMKYRFISDDPIFDLVEPCPVRDDSLTRNSQAKGKCPCCYRGVNNEKKMVDCNFCGQKVCQECALRKRAFPKQQIFEGCEPRYGTCCTLCDRKFYMK